MKKEIVELNCQNCLWFLKHIFRKLNKEELDSFNLNKYCKKVKKGHPIFNEGDIIHEIFCIHSGNVKISKIGSYKKEQIVRFAKESDLIGFRSMLAGENYTSSAIALNDCLLCVIQKDDFKKILENHPEITKDLIVLFAQEQKDGEQHTTNIAQKTVKERVAESLLNVCNFFGFESDGLTINPFISRNDISNLAGANYSNTVRFLNELKNENIIDLIGKKIKILNYDKLEKIANIKK